MTMIDPSRHQTNGRDTVHRVPTGNDAQELIAQTCDEIKEILLAKNRKYGNSALEPVRIFSKAPVIEQINVRLDDKLSRLVSGQADEDEDVELDLIGYFILRRIAKRYHDAKDT